MEKLLNKLLTRKDECTNTKTNFEITADEELILVTYIQQHNKDDLYFDDCWECIIEALKPTIEFICNKYAKNYQDYQVYYISFYDDCLFGLTRAIRKFNPEKARLVTYATKWMEKYIIKTQNEHLVKIPESASKNLKDVDKYLTQHQDEHLTIREACDACDVNYAQYTEAKNANDYQSSLDMPLDDDSDNTVGDITSDQKDLEKAYMKEETHNDLVTEIANLTALQKQFIYEYLNQDNYNSKGILVYSRIASKMKISVEKVKRIEKETLFILKRQLIKKDYSINIIWDIID